ncbi:VWA domain-containing protein [Catellatospora bangladeshensis]|uniref:Mg-protoporphyrin IX chelatase n=1 Tax=Catellatospora bangladeshensis TaxID=310355 RepID=A0A8J3JMB6_9ACTN|nr:VWA domain-containing protein [Catellatospora bangladeshensis]GIF83213.1 magnesium chelatase [Catellatospora bangladeshensis]
MPERALTPLYPFSAVVGLDDLRLALLLNAVSPGVGGVLVRGEKGTAKSTVVRALAALLPALEAVAGCRFGCDPAAPYAACPDGPHEAGSDVLVRRARLVELPVGATEDRLVGALDLERVLTSGQAAYAPGLLAAAHRGVLYVDEVNLLHDHLVDLLLDAAAMGEAYVERDGVSVRHAARFLLVGTMNPEEGELRPQLLDRFGLAVQVRAPREPRERAEVVRRRLAYEADPAGLAARWAGADAALAERIVAARTRLPGVVLPDAELIRIAGVCAAFEVDGLRADLVVARAALALAAWHGRPEVTAQDVRDAARLALPHRRRRDPFDSPDLDEQALEDALRHAAPPAAPTDSDPRDTDPRDTDPDGGPDDDGPDDRPRPDGPGGGAPDREAPAARPHGGAQRREQDGDSRFAGAGQQHAQAAAPRRARLFAVPGTGEGTAGRRSPAYTRNGRTVGARVPGGGLAALHLAATVRAAARWQGARGRRPGGPLLLAAADLREPVRRGRESNLVLFCVDASGSMAARRRMGAVKGAVLSLLLDAYQRRDKVGLVTFHGAEARLVLPPTSSVEAGAARLRELPTGGRTPLAAGLRRAAHTLRVERLRDPRRRALLVVVTDGRATAGADPVGEAMRVADGLAAGGLAAVVVDCESGPVRLGLAARLAARLGAEHVPLADVTAQGLAGVARRDRRRAA